MGRKKQQEFLVSLRTFILVLFSATWCSETPKLPATPVAEMHLKVLQPLPDATMTPKPHGLPSRQLPAWHLNSSASNESFMSTYHDSKGCNY